MKRTPLERGAVLVGGVGAVALVAAMFELVARLVDRRPDPAAPLLLAVVFAALTGGSAGGLPAAALATAYGASDWLRVDGTLTANGDHALVQLLVFAPCAAGVALIVGMLQRRGERRVERERQHGERMAALEQAKTQFLNLASHELRGPLGVVRGYVSMIQDGSFGPV